MLLIERIFRSLHRDGLFETLKSAARTFHDCRFDWKYGTDTLRRVEVNEFDTESCNKVHAKFYQATRIRPLMKLVGELGLPKNGVFVDIGCGKGRVLLIAAQLGFKRVVGIEFCARLCQVARKNADIFTAKVPASSPIEVIESDVTNVDFKGDENIFFLYNPFDAAVLEQALANITNSILKIPRDIWLIYNNPVHHEMVQSNRLFQSCKLYKIEGEVFYVYQYQAQ